MRQGSRGTSVARMHLGRIKINAEETEISRGRRELVADGRYSRGNNCQRTVSGGGTYVIVTQWGVCSDWVGSCWVGDRKKRRRAAALHMLQNRSVGGAQ
jgi:hypothetical protein